MSAGVVTYAHGVHRAVANGHTVQVDPLPLGKRGVCGLLRRSPLLKFCNSPLILILMSSWPSLKQLLKVSMLQEHQSFMPSLVNMNLSFIQEVPMTSSVNIYMAAKFKPRTPLRQSMPVKIADGAQLLCTHELLNYPWSVQGTMFTPSFKILLLQC